MYFDPINAAAWTDDVLDAYTALPWRNRVVIARTLSQSLKLAIGGMLFDREREIVRQRVESLLPDADFQIIRDIAPHRDGDAASLNQCDQEAIHRMPHSTAYATFRKSTDIGFDEWA